MRDNFWQRGGTWVLVQSVTMTAVIVLGIGLRAGERRLGATVVGIVLLTVGGLVGLAGVKLLARNRTAFPKPQADSELIRRGIYARIRHPLYLSVMLSSLGWALVWQSWPATVVALAQIPLFIFKARREERWLRDKFPDYADYAQRVPAFFPRIRPPPATV